MHLWNWKTNAYFSEKLEDEKKEKARILSMEDEKAIQF